MSEHHTMLFGGSYPVSALSQDNMQNSILGALCFSLNKHVAQTIKEQSTIPILDVPIQCLGDNQSVCECWFSQGPLMQDIEGDIHYQQDGDRLFGIAHLAESTFEMVEDKTPLHLATESAYSQIFALLEQLNYPHVFRFWNYIADINESNDELERYRQFNLGRHHAFLTYNRDVTGNVPAACALGFKQSPLSQSQFNQPQKTLCIAFLAGREQPIAIENPRQMSAYQYPQQYGPVSPTFSRASLVKLKQSELLLVSGTASIVGHATQHASDAVIQAREALINIEAILEQANRLTGTSGYSLDSLHYRVYMRHAAHMTDIENELKRFIGRKPKAEYLQADICRRDLLIEIEASVELTETLSLEMNG